MKNKETMTTFNEWLDAQHNEHELSVLLEGASLRDAEREVDPGLLRTDTLVALLGGSLATGQWRVVVQMVAELKIRENSGAIIEGIQYAFDKFPVAMSNRAPILKKTAMLLTKFELRSGSDHLLHDYAEYLAAGHHASPADWAKDTDHGLPAKLARERHERSPELTAKDKVRQMLHSTDDAWIEAYLETKRKSVAEQTHRTV